MHTARVETVQQQQVYRRLFWVGSPTGGWRGLLELCVVREAGLFDGCGYEYAVYSRGETSRECQQCIRLWPNYDLKHTWSMARIDYTSQPYCSVYVLEQQVQHRL